MNEKQRKTIEGAVEKQTKALHTLNRDQPLKSIGDLFSKDNSTSKAKEEKWKKLKQQNEKSLELI